MTRAQIPGQKTQFQPTILRQTLSDGRPEALPRARSLTGSQQPLLKQDLVVCTIHTAISILLAQI